MEDFKDQTVGIEGRTIGNGFLDVFEGEQAPFGWKHLGLVLREISRVRSSKRKEHLRKKKIIEEKKGASMPNLFFLFPFPFFFF